jgi:amino acid transporter
VSEFDRLAASGPNGLARDLSLPELSSFGITSSAPMTVVAGASTALFALGVPGTPLLFLAVGAIAGLWVVGYAALSRHVQSAGAQAAFITRGLGRTAGVAATGVALVSYTAIYLCLYGLCGTVAAPVIARWTGITKPWWLWALAAVLGVGLLGRARIKLAGRILTWLLAAEVAAVVLVDLAGLTHPAGGSYDLTDLNPATLWHHGLTGLGGAVAYTVACLVGFEETPGLAEDAQHGDRDIRRALLITVAFLGFFYTASFAAISIGEGPTQVAGIAADPASGFPFNLIHTAYGPAGPMLADIANVLLVTSVFAALASFHTVATRYTYAASRDRVLPLRLAAINPRNSSPSTASRAVTLVAFVVVAGFAITGTDPIAGLFAWGSYTAAVGILALMIGSSAAVIGFFHGRLPRHSRFTTVLAPAVSAVLMTGLWLLMLTSPQTMIGAELFSPTHLALLALPAAGLVAGLARAGVLRRAGHHTWRRIGAPTPAEFPNYPKDPSYAEIDL